MQAVKGNKVYTIDETAKAGYIDMGYDIMEAGDIIAYGKGKTVAYSEYVKLMKENEDLRAKLEEAKLHDTEKKPLKKNGKE